MIDRQTTARLLEARGHGAQLPELVRITLDLHPRGIALDVLKLTRLAAGGKLLSVEDAQARYQTEFGETGDPADLLAISDRLATFELTGLDWVEPKLIDAAAKINAARALLAEAAQLVQDVRDGLL